MKHMTYEEFQQEEAITGLKGAVNCFAALITGLATLFVLMAAGKHYQDLKVLMYFLGAIILGMYCGMHVVLTRNSIQRSKELRAYQKRRFQ